MASEWSLERLGRLLELGNGHIPGDRVRIGPRARDTAVRGMSGTVVSFPTVEVRLDNGALHYVTPQSLVEETT